MIDPLHPSDAELSVQPETGTGELRLDLTRRLTAEALGTALLIIAVVGSGIMASRLSPNDVGLQLLENAAATAGALVGLILIFGAVSGAHFNPVVTIVDRLLGTVTTRDAGLYVVAQTVGGCVGTVLAISWLCPSWCCSPSPARVVRPAVAPTRKPLPRASAFCQIRSPMRWKPNIE